MMKIWTVSCAGLISLLLATMSFAQREGDSGTIDPEPRNTVTKDTIQARDQRQADTAQLAAWLSMGNKAEIELAELALAKSDQADVQKFARMMVDDHTQLWKSLQQFVPVGQAEDRNDTGTAAERREIAAQQNNTMMLVGKTAATYKLRMTKQLLEKYQGQDFDMGYLGQQMVAHVEMLATLEAMKNYGTDEFQQIVAGIEKTRSHMQQAFLISRKLEDDRRNPDARPLTSRPADNRVDPTLPDTTLPLDTTRPDATLPDASPRPQFDLDGPDVNTDIKPRATIKEDVELEPQSDLNIQP